VDKLSILHVGHVYGFRGWGRKDGVMAK
jgi:hypothetical protein